MPKALRQRNSNDKKNPDQDSKKRKAVEGRKDKSAASKKAKRPTVKPPRPPAHQKRDGICWARKTNGSICNEKWAKNQFIPYCNYHLQKGDGAVKVVQHPDPMHGKILVARYPLPRGYQLVYWGKRERITAANEKNDDRQIHFFLNDFTQYGVIDPTDCPGCVMQFAASPGKGEYPTLHTTSNHFGTTTSEMCGRSYQLIRDVKTNEQVAHSYGNEWFEGRGIKRQDVSCVKYPLPKRPIAPKALQKIAERKRKEKEKLKKQLQLEDAKRKKEEEKKLKIASRERALRMRRRKLMNRSIA